MLITRSHDGITLTRDGEIFFPYFESILAGERALHVRMKEMHGLTGSLIRIGTFSSISQNLLPPLISSFLVSYPETRFELLQGEYTSIAAGIKSGDLDFGFVSPEFVSGLQTETIYTDTMMAVLPLSSPLAVLSSVSLSQLASLPCILLDEGRYSVALKAFEAHNLTPDIRFKVTDDYTILAMIRRQMGYSLMYRLTLAGAAKDVAVIPIREPFHRTIAMGWRDFETLPYAARKFITHIRREAGSRGAFGCGRHFPMIVNDVTVVSCNPRRAVFSSPLRSETARSASGRIMSASAKAPYPADRSCVHILVEIFLVLC